MGFQRAYWRKFAGEDERVFQLHSATSGDSRVAARDFFLV